MKELINKCTQTITAILISSIVGHGVYAQKVCCNQIFVLKIFWQILVQEKLLALMVTQEDNTIGILRLADVFAAVYHTMAECNI